MLTRKHYIEIASYLRELPEDKHKDLLLKKLSHYFLIDNNNFDVDKFYTACQQ